MTPYKCSKCKIIWIWNSNVGHYECNNKCKPKVNNYENNIRIENRKC